MLPEWELAELTTQADLHNQRIADSEISVADDYWLLGRILERVRGNFPRGTWQPWLDRHGIDRTRAKRARLLAGVFASTEEMAGPASLVTSPSHGTLTLNSDGSFSYTPDPGWLGYDSFGYQASDGVMTSGATVTLHTEYSVLSAVDQTKVPVDTIHVGQRLFNVPLVYDSVLAQPDQVIEADIGLSDDNPLAQTLTATLTFNGAAQAPVYFSLNTMSGSDAHVHLAQQIDTSGLSSGRYGWSLLVTSPDMSAPATLSGYVNVVNDSASPFGKGWDMPRPLAVVQQYRQRRAGRRAAFDGR